MREICTAIIRVKHVARFCGEASTRTYRLTNGTTSRCAEHKRIHIED